MQALAVIYLCFPVFFAAVLVYGRPPAWAAALELGLAALLGAAGVLDTRRARLGQWDRFSANFTFLQVLLGVGLATTMNLTSTGNPAVYGPTLLLPALATALMGDGWMMGATWLLTAAAIGWAAWHHTHDGATTAWVAAVWGSVLVCSMAAVHVVVQRFRKSARVTEALRDLAEQGVSLQTWPEGVVPCLALIARSLEASHVEVLAQRHDRLELVGAWPAPAATPAIDQEGARAAVEAPVGFRRGRLVIPVTTTLDPQLLLVALRPSAPGGALLGFLDEDRATARTVAGLLAGMADRAALVEKLEHQARSDTLTGLANRRVLAETMDREVARAARSGGSLTVVMIDIDHFKDYNDTFGHAAGDRLLARFAERITARARRADLVARYGGEEFCLVLPSADLQGAEALLQDMRREGPVADGHGNGVTFSAGIAQWHPGDSGAALIERADQALYQAKRAGRDRVQVTT